MREIKGTFLPFFFFNSSKHAALFVSDLKKDDKIICDRVPVPSKYCTWYIATDIRSSSRAVINSRDGSRRGLRIFAPSPRYSPRVTETYASVYEFCGREGRGGASSFFFKSTYVASFKRFNVLRARTVRKPAGSLTFSSSRHTFFRRLRLIL